MSKRSKLVTFLVLFALAVGGCASRSAPAQASDPSPAAPARQPLSTRTAAQSDKPATARRIIKNGSLSLDVDDPDAASARAAHIAEEADGYVASTERHGARDDSAHGSVKMVLRVPAERFARTLAALHALAPGRGSEQISTEDVSEEYIDLAARLKTQKQLEQQYLKILERATRVEDALAVQKQLAEVRTEIEKIEGRQRFLDNRVALSTITLDLGLKAPLVAAHWSDLGKSVRQAGTDTVNVTSALVTGSIRVAGALLPVFVLFGLPLLLLVRRLRRRRATA